MSHAKTARHRTVLWKPHVKRRKSACGNGSSSSVSRTRVRSRRLARSGGRRNVVSFHRTSDSKRHVVPQNVLSRKTRFGFCAGTARLISNRAHNRSCHRAHVPGAVYSYGDDRPRPSVRAWSYKNAARLVSKVVRHVGRSCRAVADRRSTVYPHPKRVRVSGVAFLGFQVASDNRVSSYTTAGEDRSYTHSFSSASIRPRAVRRHRFTARLASYRAFPPSRYVGTRV